MNFLNILWNHFFGASQPAPTSTTNTITTSNEIEWSLLQRFRSHHRRLERKNKYRPFKLPQGIRSIAFENDTELFDTGLRQILTMSGLDDLVQYKLELHEEVARKYLRELCETLDQFTNVDLLENSTIHQTDRQKYSKLEPLLDLLQVTTWNFDLLPGKGNSLFQLEAESHAIKAQKAVKRFIELFSPPTPTPQALESRSQLLATAERLRKSESRGRTFRALDALLTQISQEQTKRKTKCPKYLVLVKLPDLDIFNSKEVGPSHDLELFISTGPIDSPRWHPCHCDLFSPA